MLGPGDRTRVLEPSPTARLLAELVVLVVHMINNKYNMTKAKKLYLKRAKFELASQGGPRDQLLPPTVVLAMEFLPTDI